MFYRKNVTSGHTLADLSIVYSKPEWTISFSDTPCYQLNEQIMCDDSI